jgi:NADPH-dependent curcumin reductase CurA
MEYINKQYLLDKRPTGMPTDDCWKLHEEKITSLKKNEILIEAKYLSIDPYMRGRMNDSKSYAAPAKIGEPMTGETAGIVVESNSDLFSVGDKV